MSGKVLHVSATSHPDLFWALRGGGANYAIVTAFEFEVVPAPTNITYASLWWQPTAANLGAVLKAFAAWHPWQLHEDVARVHIGMCELLLCVWSVLLATSYGFACSVCVRANRTQTAHHASPPVMPCSLRTLFCPYYSHQL